jgi:hypothetical protein
MKVEQGSKEDLLIGHHIGLTLCLDTPSWINQRKSLAANAREGDFAVLEDATRGFRGCDVVVGTN